MLAYESKDSVCSTAPTTSTGKQYLLNTLFNKIRLYNTNYLCSWQGHLSPHIRTRTRVPS